MHLAPMPPPHIVTHVTHHVVLRHRVEVEIYPPRVELAFRDEKWVNPITTQARFEALVYNSTAGVAWEVLSPSGGPGAGSIDQQGLYRAPLKGSLASAHTDLVAATAVEDLLRKAFAWVTVLGEGPEPAPIPAIEIWPKRVSLYYRQGSHNAYIDESNKQQLFSASPRFAGATGIDWLVNGVVQASGSAPVFLYQAPAAGATAQVTVRARLSSHPTVHDDAKVSLLNYFWPGL
jgi:hypothetical protein